MEVLNLNVEVNLICVAYNCINEVGRASQGRRVNCVDDAGRISSISHYSSPSHQMSPNGGNQ